MDDSCERPRSCGDLHLSTTTTYDGRTRQQKHDSDEEPSLPLRDFYPYIRCGLCSGFFIDATTVTECLHTFCKSCIVKHFFYSNRCPNCDVVVHQTQPLYNIRPDRQLQDIVYKMVPSLEEAERTRMCAFYKGRGLAVPKPVAVPSLLSPKPPKQKQKDMMLQSVFTIPPELDVSLMLVFVGAEEGIENYKPLERKYVRVSGEATIRHVELFIRRKMELSSDLQVSALALLLAVSELRDDLDPSLYVLAMMHFRTKYQALLVDVVCGEHLLEQRQSLREVRSSLGENALQDGMLVLQFGLVLPGQ